MMGTPPNPVPSPREVMQDLQHLIALRPPTDPATGRMFYDITQAAKYRQALQDILDRYGTMENFQEALQEFATGPGPQLASAAAPSVPDRHSLANGSPSPNFMTGPPAASSLMQFARSMMAPGRPPAAAGVAPDAGPSTLIPRPGAGTVL